ncbi:MULTISPECIES: acetolactate synthase 2 small subunit [unclassified Brenneria]|uniref:acetolactate synthase 2 small subunit n=1 Tax=unclassified Brenneria TaxID=2634434 RepID=UPI0015537DAB|nr:acetolactate synthase 2 small subunit [Brenneria sp. hezel4-2-4]MEE3652578.1 acetolactate synthase 2 small subunit [Brenneria sp. HEZEL_4_2_4]NPD02534.1 acetolactate synthase 2 small subunit [Brenneria sp. hezel4-2-4]
MTRHQLSIQARFRPEILERVLRVVRHRGFQICAMNMVHTTNTDDHINIELTVASHRPIDLLSAQLSKLLDIAYVDVQPMTTSQQFSA